MLIQQILLCKDRPSRAQSAWQVGVSYQIKARQLQFMVVSIVYSSSSTSLGFGGVVYAHSNGMIVFECIWYISIVYRLELMWRDI